VRILERANIRLILVKLRIVPSEAALGMSDEWREAITSLELRILGMFTAEHLLRCRIGGCPWKYALFEPKAKILSRKVGR